MRNTVLTGWLIAAGLLLFSLGCGDSAKLQVTPTQLNFGTIAGDAHMRLTVKNVGDSSLLGEEYLGFELHMSEAWLHVESYDKQPLARGESQSFEVWVKRGILQQGRNNGWVDVTSNGGNKSVMALVWRDDTP